MSVVAMALGMALLQGQDPQAQEARIGELIQRLGAEDPAERERADEELRRIGEPAVPHLERVLEDPDPERRARAERILQEIRRPTQERQQERPLRSPPGVRLSATIDTPTYRVTINDEGVRLTLKATGETFEAPSVEEFIERFPQYEQYVPRFGQRGEGFQFDFEDLFRDRDVPWFEFRRGFRWPPLEREFDDLPRSFEELQRQLEERLERRFELPEFEDIPRFGRRVQRGRDELGARFGPLAEEVRARHDLAADEGVVVESVEENGAAARVGLRAGDIVVAVEGERVGDRWTLVRRLARALEGGGSARLTVVRDGTRREVTIRNARVHRDL